MNLSPDSFYHKSSISNKNIKLQEYIDLKYKHADIVDIGAESSRPNSRPISKKTEMNRFKIIENINFNKKILSVDSYKYDIIKYCLKNGFCIINDISGGGKDFINIILANEYSSSIILMHMQGTPLTMQVKPKYNNIIDDLLSFFDKRISYALKIGMNSDSLILDPGIGFGKTIKHNDQILLNLDRFKSLGCKVLLGLSRKSFLMVDNDMPEDRLAQTLGVSAISAYNGADILRVHDVEYTYKMLKIIDRYKYYGN